MHNFKNNELLSSSKLIVKHLKLCVMKIIKLLLSLFILSSVAVSCTDLDEQEMERATYETSQLTGGEDGVESNGGKD